MKNNPVYNKYWWKLGELTVEQIRQEDGTYHEFHNGVREGNNHVYTEDQIQRIVKFTKNLNWNKE